MAGPGPPDEPATIAIVDDRPEAQYLFPEFLLAKALLERRGLRASIVDPSELVFSNGRLQVDGETVDIVYNRLVDFSLSDPGHEAVRAAYSAGAVVLTPNPRNHALLADKRNLTLLSDVSRRATWGISAEQQASLIAIPETVVVTADNAADLWADRKRLFFKPDSGYGGKAVYRGDKLTRGVWDVIQKGGFIAQRFAPPSERRLKVDGETQSLKLDVRVYTYAGEPLLIAARTYRGQTTNFRTPGGGFAPVFLV